MLVAERYEKIVQVVNDRGSIRVTELSKLFHVTEETIRRDLDHLEKGGLLRRSHGGAVSVKPEQPETPFFEREVTNVMEKQNIAREAVKYIVPGQRIILDASTTAWYMASILPNITLTVLTNSIKVALELSGKDKINVISTGGALSSRSLSFVGPLAEQALEQYHVDSTFLSCKGIHVERGMSESNEFQARMKQKMLEAADQSFLLVDYSKFGIKAFAYVDSVDACNIMITDAKAPESEINELSALNIEVIQIRE